MESWRKSGTARSLKEENNLCSFLPSEPLHSADYRWLFVTFFINSTSKTWTLARGTLIRTKCPQLCKKLRSKRHCFKHFPLCLNIKIESTGKSCKCCCKRHHSCEALTAPMTSNQYSGFVSYVPQQWQKSHLVGILKGTLELNISWKLIKMLMTHPAPKGLQ